MTMRHHFEEEEWSRLTAGLALPQHLPWTAPLMPPGEHDSTIEFDAATVEAVQLHTSALVEVQVATSFDGTALVGALWTDGAVGAALVRRVRPGGSPGTVVAVPGLELSMFAVADFAAELMRLVPDLADSGSSPTSAPSFTAPADLAFVLGRAIRSHDEPMTDAVCAELGMSRPPRLIDALVRTMRGNATVSIRSAGRDTATFGSWLLCNAGWVELSLSGDGDVRHTPRRRRAIADAVLFDVTSRLGLFAA
jgi:hypothetical protein